MSLNPRRVSRRHMIGKSLAASAAAAFSGGALCQSPLLGNLAAHAVGRRPAKSCIMLWMSGGPSQLETLDPKPGHKNGGPTTSIATAVPGIHLSEHLPKTASHMQDMALIRSMKTREGDHQRATQLMSTGYRPMAGVVQYPVLGSMVSHRLNSTNSLLPGFVSIAPSTLSTSGAGFLGPIHAPLVVSGISSDPSARANLTIENMQPVSDHAAMARKLGLLSMMRSQLPTTSASADTHAAAYEQATRMVQTQGEGAFKLDEEPDVLRDAYGRNRFGQGCLLARRLIERGVSFVEVTLQSADNATWDSHVDNFRNAATQCETLDPAWSTLLQDLKQRNMLDDTMVVWMGEFGRTPKINATTGRDHFPDAWSVALAGGNLPGGAVIGETSAGGEEIQDRAVTAPDLTATLLQLLGIDHESENYDGDRPIVMVEEGEPIQELTS